MHLTEEPMFRLLDCIDMPGLSKVLQAECKVELADILLMNGAIWDASLYYGQVEKDFKNDVIGFEAKFKYAKIFYYTGDFRWAQSQLDVLKSSTHKLIANDAMQLSILISDNYNLDTVGVAMELYSQAELLTYQNKFDDALAKLDTINMIYPWHTLNDEILMQKYRIAYGQGEYEESAVYLTEIVSKYGDDILADDALFYLAKLYDHVLDDDETAMGFYSDLVLNYTGSLYTVEASERYRFLRGDFSIEKGDAVELDLDADPQEVLSGDQKVYNDDQQLIMEGWFENGELKDGKLYEYDESGELIRISIFENFEFIGDEDIDIE